MKTRAAIFMLVVLLAAVLVAAAARWDAIQLATGWGLPQRTGPSLLIIGRQGDLDAHPENTAEAIWAAAALRPDGIEIDVHRSASGTWYVIHDASLDRTTDGSGSISTLPDDVIDSAVIDAGLGFEPDFGSPVHVPRLEAVVAGLTDFRGTVYLDVQHAETGDPAELLKLTEGMSVAIICRSPADATAVKARDSRVETILSVTHASAPDVDGLLAEASLHGSPGFTAGLALPVTQYVERFDQDEYGLLRRAWATGVKAFITNHLEAALATRDKFASGEP